MSSLVRFLQADWPKALRLAAITWVCTLVIAVGQAAFADWEARLANWIVVAPLFFLFIVALRAIWFFGTYAALYSRMMSFEEAYERFAARREP